MAAGSVVLIYRGGGGAMRGEMLRALLEGSGIECYVRFVGATGGYPANVGALGEFELYVHPEDVAVAQDLLEDLDE